MEKKLNLGCGEKWREQYSDYEGLDIIDYGQKYVGDVIIILQKIEEQSYDKIVAFHFLEHFDQNELKNIFSNLNRILKVGGTLKFIVPHKEKGRSWILSHKTFWNDETIKWLAEKEAREVYGFGSWKLLRMDINDRDDIETILEKICT